MMTTFSPSAAAVLAHQAGMKLDADHGLLFKGKALDAAAVELGLSMAYGLQFERGDAERVLVAARILAMRSGYERNVAKILRELDKEDQPAMIDAAKYADIKLRWLPPRGVA